MTSKRLKGEQLSLIKPPRKGGNPKPKPGRWGVGVETKTTRVPVALADVLPDILNAVVTTTIRYAQRRRQTRNWVEANKMLDELLPLVAILLDCIQRSETPETSDRE